MSLIPSGELKEHHGVLNVPEHESINESNSLRGVESFMVFLLSRGFFEVSMSLIPSGELKVTRPTPLSRSDC